MTRGLLAIALVLGAATPVAAQTTPDGVARPAFQAAARTRLLRADTDGDGRLSKAELTDAAKARGAKRDPGRWFGRLDTNGDGYLDSAEIDALTARRFTRLDADGNGVVTAAERSAGRGGMAD